MKGKKSLCEEFCNYCCQNFVVIVVFFQKKLTNLITVLNDNYELLQDEDLP